MHRLGTALSRAPEGGADGVCEGDRPTSREVVFGLLCCFVREVVWLLGYVFHLIVSVWKSVELFF